MDEARVPDFIGIGVMKGGSSWIYQQLKTHPQVGTPLVGGKRVKEMHFIDRMNMSLPYYLSRFARLNTFKCGEYTPNYVCCPYAPEFIKFHFPNARLLCVFRNPTDRAFSHYKDHLYYGKIPAGTGFMTAFNDNYPLNEQHYYSIKNKGMYGDQLELWQKHFSSEQLKIMFYDDLAKNPLEFIQEIFKHFELVEYIPPSYSEKAVKRYNRAYDAMIFEEKDKQEVREFYKEQVSKLSELTGRKLDW